MQCQINSNSENYFFISLYGKELIHEGQNVSLQSGPHMAFYYSDVRRWEGPVANSSKFLTDVMGRAYFEIEWVQRSFSKEGWAISTQRPFFSRRTRIETRSTKCSIRVTPGYFSEVQGGYLLGSYAAKRKPGECCKIRRSISEERY